MSAIMCELSREQRQMLHDRSIQPMQLDYNGNKMWVIYEADLNIALQLLGKELGESRASGYEGIRLAQLVTSQNGAAPRRTNTAGGAAQAMVTIRGNQVTGQGSMDRLSKLIRTMFLPKIRKKVVVHSVGGKRSAPNPNQDFHIHLFASPEGDRRYKPPKKLFGVELPSRKNSYHPSGQGKSFIDPESGWVVAELVGQNNLYIHHNVMNAKEADAQVLEKVLELVLREMPEVVETRPAVATGDVTVYDEKREAARQAYVQACSERVGDEVVRIQQQVETSRAEVERLRAQLTSAQQNAYLAEAKLSSFRDGNAGAIDRLKSEYDTMINHPLITDVRVEAGEIQVFTSFIHATDPRTQTLYEIGQFRITLSTTGNGKIRWKNLTRRVKGGNEGMHAPHVDQNGKACMGNTQQSFAKLLADSEFANAAFLAIEFVQSVNVDDGWGKYINRWPEAVEQEAA